MLEGAQDKFRKQSSGIQLVSDDFCNCTDTALQQIR
uniref:Uncharacterized protein n=1 Tax=Rhizophora mucronata TaxID=61149 RepID=A0A2P2PI17_RHIMU